MSNDRGEHYDPERGERGYYDEGGRWVRVEHPDAWQVYDD